MWQRIGKKVMMLAAAVLLAVLPASAQMSKLRFRGFEVKSVVPIGLRTLRATVEFEMVNSGQKEFEMSDIDLTIYRDGKPFVTGKCPSIPVDKGESTIKAVGTFRLAEGVSLLSALRSVLNIDLKDYAADVTLTALGDNGRDQDFMLKGFSVAKVAKSRKK